jgi:ElaB/YqjD/DUF883 family membrane-anchored ribosome-binding protein
MNAQELKSKAEAAFDKETYEEIVTKLSDEKDRLEHELKKNYRNTRHYVRKHPEQGVGFSFLGGLVIGFVIAKLLDD